MMQRVIKVPGVSRFGRRTLVLVHAGATWIVFGFVVNAVPIERFSRPGPDGPLQFMDSPLWGTLWIAGGTIAIANAIIRRQVTGRDVAGFMGILTPPILWFACYGWSAATYLVTDGTIGHPRASTGFLTWYLVSALVLIMAGWPDPTDPDIQIVEERGSPE